MKAKQETINKLRDLILASEGEEYEYYCEACGATADSNQEHIISKKLKALDSNLTLERVLRALGSSYGADGYGTILSTQYQHCSCCESLRETDISWTLTLPAHEQEEETLQALIDILTPTKK